MGFVELGCIFGVMIFLLFLLFAPPVMIIACDVFSMVRN